MSELGENVVAAWPFLLRDRLTRRAHGSERFRWWVLWTVLAGLFSVNVTFTVFAVALPRVAGEFGTSTNTILWVITGPMLASGVVAPVLGKLGDLYGHRRVYLIGLVGALACSALSAVAWTAASLIAIRILAAITWGAAGSASMALILSEFDPEDRVKAMGWWSLVGAGGPVIGVALGGPAIEAFGWRLLFAAQVPMIIASFGLAVAVLKETDRGARHRLDWAGALTLGLGVGGVLFAFNRAPDLGWTSPAVIGAFLLAPAMLAAFVAVERRAAEPLLPLDVIRRRNFAMPIGASTFANFAYMGGFILAPQLLAEVFGYGESRIGGFVVVRPLMFSLAAPAAGYLAVRIGERTAAVAGTTLVVGSMAVFAAVGEGSSALLVLAGLALSGIGLGCAQPSISSSVANSVDEADLGIASAAQQLVMQVGVVSGIQVMSTVRESTGSFSTAYLVGGAVGVLGVVLATFLRSSSRDASSARVSPR